MLTLDPQERALGNICTGSVTVTSRNVGTILVVVTSSRLCRDVRIWLCPRAALNLNVAAISIAVTSTCLEGGGSFGLRAGKPIGTSLVA